MPVGDRGPRSCPAPLADSSPSIHDITEGSNFTPDTVCGYLCTAEPGDDGPTGLSTPNGSGGS